MSQAPVESDPEAPELEEESDAGVVVATPDEEDTTKLPREPAPPKALRAPVRHPKTMRLIGLEVAKAVKQRQLTEIEAGLEAAAAPVAIEIERLEAEEATIAQALRANAERFCELDRQDALRVEVAEQVRLEREAQDERIRQDGLRIEAERAELSAAAQVFASGQEVVAASIVAARARFGEVSTTSTGRALERAIAKIERQQKTILDRNPGARLYRLEMAIEMEAERLGFHDDVRAVSACLRTDEFGKQISEKIREIQKARKALPSELEVWEAAIGIIESLGVNAESVEVTASVGPGGIHIRSKGINDAARDLCMQAVAARIEQPTTESPETQPAAETA